jgi:VIT1/CCC1 family predicted Fe2+/Mn2+ transporter
MIGVAAASTSKQAILRAGVAGLVAGSMPMAVGECVSVSAQPGSEQADIEREKRELANEPRAELNELAMIYMKGGLEKNLAMKVVQQISAHDRLGSHTCGTSLGSKTRSLARPLQAAWISATSFASLAAIS